MLTPFMQDVALFPLFGGAIRPDKPVIPDIPDIQNPLDPSTWNGIPDNITEDSALEALQCVEMFYND